MAGKEVPAKERNKCREPESPRACMNPGAEHPGRKDWRCLPEGAEWYPHGKLTLLPCPWSGEKEGRPVPSWWLAIKAVKDPKEQLIWFFNFSEPQFPNL